MPWLNFTDRTGRGLPIWSYAGTRSERGVATRCYRLADPASLSNPIQQRYSISPRVETDRPRRSSAVPAPPISSPPPSTGGSVATAYVPTSEILKDLFERVSCEVTPTWLIENLRERSFGIVLLLLGLLSLLPGASGVVAILLLYPAWQLMGGQATPSLPSFIF